MANQQSLGALLATPQGSKAITKEVEPLVNAYMALFQRFPKMTCFLSGVIFAAAVSATRETTEPLTPCP